MISPKPFVIISLVYSYSVIVSSYPFFYGPTHALTTLLGASSGNTYPTHGNIEDLRGTPKHSHEAQKVELPPLENDEEGSGDDGILSPDINEPEHADNDASPSLLQKKIDKILRKLNVIRQLHNAITQNSGTSNNEGKPMVEVKINDDENQDSKETEDLDTILDNTENLAQQIQNSTLSKVDLASSNPGVYLMELVGSVVGLAVGAIGQFQHYRPSSTSQPFPEP